MGYGGTSEKSSLTLINLYDAIRQLMAPPEPKPRRIGFRA